MNASSWPEDHSKKLSCLVTGGEKSYAEIAAAINAEFGTEYSRNAAIGRAGRMGLTNPFQIKTAKKEPGPTLAKRTRLVRSNSNSTALRLIHVNEPTGPGALRCVEVESRKLTLLDLEPKDCRFPDGEGSDITFCGQEKMGGSSYCPAHFVLTKGKSYQISEADHERRRRHFMGLNKQSVKAMGVWA